MKPSREALQQVWDASPEYTNEGKLYRMVVNVQCVNSIIKSSVDMVEINVPSYSERTGDDWNIACEGTLEFDRKSSTALIKLYKYCYINKGI